MDTRKIPVFCYWNCCIKNGPDGPFFEGPVSKVIRVESNIELPKLLDHLHQVTGFEKGKFQMEMICRYPYIVQQSTVKYVCMPVLDDSSLETMLEVPSHHTSINIVELYLKVTPVPAGLAASPFANEATRKRPRHECVDTDTDVNVSVGDETLRTPLEDNGIKMIEEDKCRDGGNSGSDGNNVSAEKDSNMKKPGPTKSLTADASKQLIFSSSWLDERELHLGMLFQDQHKLDKAVKLYSDRRQRTYTRYESSYSGTCEYKCTSYCQWILKAAKTNSNGFKVTEYKGPHSCRPAHVSSDFLAGELKGVIKARPLLLVAELNMWVKEEFGYTVSYTTTCILLIFDNLAEIFKSRHAESVDERGLYAKHVMKNLEEFKVASQTHGVLPLDQTGEKYSVYFSPVLERRDLMFISATGFAIARAGYGNFSSIHVRMC